MHVYISSCKSMKMVSVNHDSLIAATKSFISRATKHASQSSLTSHLSAFCSSPQDQILTFQASLQPHHTAHTESRQGPPGRGNSWRCACVQSLSHAAPDRKGPISAQQTGQTDEARRIPGILQLVNKRAAVAWFENS